LGPCSGIHFDWLSYPFVTFKANVILTITMVGEKVGVFEYIETRRAVLDLITASFSRHLNNPYQ
jgi:hypothetical protein